MKNENFDDHKVFTAVFCHFSLCMHKINIISISRPKSVVTVVLSDIDVERR